jgi:hypothetical protein
MEVKPLDPGTLQASDWRPLIIQRFAGFCTTEQNGFLILLLALLLTFLFGHYLLLLQIILIKRHRSFF